MNNIIEKIRNTRILAIIGIIGLFLGTMFTYVKFSVFGYSYKISLWGYWEGKIVILLAIATTLFIFKDVIQKFLPSLFDKGVGRKIAELDNPKLAIIPTILSAVLAIYLYITLDIDTSYASYGLGFYAIWIGVISLIAYAILYKRD